MADATCGLLANAWALQALVVDALLRAAARFTELSFTAPPGVQGPVGTNRFDGEPDTGAAGSAAVQLIR